MSEEKEKTPINFGGITALITAIASLVGAFALFHQGSDSGLVETVVKSESVETAVDSETEKNSNSQSDVKSNTEDNKDKDGK